MEKINKHGPVPGDTNTEKARLTRQVTWVGLGLNLVLFSVKLTVGIIGFSHAVIADAIHSLSDMGTDIAILFGIKFWLAPADEDHPYGHLRLEAIITAAIGVSLLAVAVGIGYHAVISLRSGYFQQPGQIALFGALFSIFSKEALYRWSIAVGTRIKSSAVIANAWHHRSDALSSIPAFIAVGAAAFYPKLAFADQVGAFVVSFIILKVSWSIVSPAFSELADRGAPKKDRERIQFLAMHTEGVETVHKIRTRKIGAGLFVDLHIQVDGNMSVHKGHDISEIVKSNLMAKGPEIMDVVVHIEPYG